MKSDFLHFQEDVILKHLNETYEDAFFELVDNEDVKKYFEHFNGSKEEIVWKLKGLNEESIDKQYWGIFLDDGKLIGYISLSKDTNLLKHFNQGQVLKKDDLDFSEESADQKRSREAKERALAPFAVNVVIHREFRGKGYGRAALNAVFDYARQAGIDALYFDIHKDNIASKSLITAAGAEFFVDPDNYFYPSDIYKLSLPPTAETATEKQIFKKLFSSDRERSGYDKWREICAQILELLNHKILLTQLFADIYDKKTDIRLNPALNACHFVSNFLEKTVYITTKKRDFPLTIIWSIAHEYGHACQAPPTEKEQILYSKEMYLREANAWDIAEKWFSDKPFYQFNWPDFIRFRNSRLVEGYLPPYRVDSVIQGSDKTTENGS